MATHAVLNQAPPLGEYNLFTADPVLAGVVESFGAGHGAARLARFGARFGRADAWEWGFQANEYPPQLRTHDRFGHRIDEVEFHPAWHALLDLSVAEGVHSTAWEADGGFAVRAVLMYLSAQVEAGHGCPISMTSAVVPALRHQPDLAAVWEPAVLSRQYDRRPRPVGEKEGALFGMGMTEKQGGSDVRANTTSAEAVAGGGPGAEYRVTGHKWFTSAPMCDAFLVLAQAPSGLSCLLMPRWLPGGERNAIHIQRLKHKLGNRSNASAELEFEEASAWLVGEEGRGVQVILEMVNGTRLDCASASAGLMRQAVTRAAHHAAHRRAFGSLLVDKPLMRNVLADLEIETEATTLLMLRAAAAFDRAGSEHEALLRRVLTPVAKYWVTKRCSEVVREAMECLGGNGYVEESILPRLYRESPVNAIWEGSGNVIALDVLRALRREENALDAFVAEVEGLGGDRLRRACDGIVEMYRAAAGDESQGRRIVERMAVVLSAALLLRHGRPEVAEAYVRTRVEGEGGMLYGTLPPGLDLAAIVEPAIPR